jgi:hypothetical protein
MNILRVVVSFSGPLICEFIMAALVQTPPICKLMNNENFVYDGVEGNFSSGHPAPSNTGIIHRQSFAALPSTTNNRLDHLPISDFGEKRRRKTNPM